MFENVNLDKLWIDTDYSRETYQDEVPTDELIAEVEQKLGYKLPASYITLMKMHNGGCLNYDACPCDTPTSWADDHVGVTGIFSISTAKEHGLCGEFGSQFWIDEWEYPAIGVAIADCPSGGHDMIFLDYHECGPQGEPCVVHIDADETDTTFLAKDFETFIELLRPEDDYH